jgi:hypothetical protein
MLRPGPDFVAVTFALFKLGAVLVLVDPGIGPRRLRACLAEAEPAAFIGIPRAQIARVLLGWARDSIRIRITVGGFGAVPGRRLADLLLELLKGVDRATWISPGYKRVTCDGPGQARLLRASSSA